MANSRLILILLAFVAMTLADSYDGRNAMTAEELEGRVYIKDSKFNDYLFFDPLSMDSNPKALLWNVPNTTPPRGGAWFHLSKSPVYKDVVDYNLLGGLQSNFTLCVSMLQPENNDSLHFIHGYIDNNHLEAPECRWLLKVSTYTTSFWLVNKLYNGHLKAGGDRVDPLRRNVFLETQDTESDEREMWMIGKVLEPNDKKEYYYDDDDS